jgi:hypothetical protein
MAALWNIKYFHINLRAGELPGPPGVRVVPAADSRGNPADPSPDLTTGAG